MDAIIRNFELPRKARVEEFDYFSEGVGISFGGHDRSKTKCGALTTICILTAMGYLFYYYLSNALDTTSPKLQFDTLTDSKALQYSISNTDMKFFLLLSNPALKTVTKLGAYVDPSLVDEDAVPSDSDLIIIDPTIESSSSEYVNINNYMYYYNISAKYVTSKTNKLANGTSVSEVTVFPVPLISCSKAPWFTDVKIKEYRDRNEFATKRVGSDGICLDVNKSHTLYGNWLSSVESSLIIEIRSCPGSPNQTVTCSENAKYAFTGISDIENGYLGSFSSTVNNSDKENPFVYDYQSHAEFPMTQMTNSLLTVYLKRLQVLTDVGILFPDINNVSVGIIDSISRSTASNLAYSYFEVDSLDPAAAVGDLYKFTGVLPDESKPMATLNIKGSSRTDQYSRKYDTIFDFIGNFGGAMEMVLISMTLLTIYLEDKLKDNRLKRVCMEQLGLAKIVKSQEKRRKDMAKTKKIGCCKKKDDHILEEYIDEVVEEGLSFESLVKINLTNKLLKDSLVPQEVSTIAPIYYSLMKSRENKRQEEELAAKKKSKRDIVVSPLSAKKASEASTEDDQMSIKEAIAKLMSPQFDIENPGFAPLKKKILEMMPEIKEHTQESAQVGEVELISHDREKLKNNYNGESMSSPLKSNKICEDDIPDLDSKSMERK